MKQITLLVFFINIQLFALCQSAEHKAQGYYYKAKELYESNSYSAAIPYIEKAKQTLNGTNYQIQFLHIMSLVKLQDWIGARKEMVLYYDVIEEKTKAVNFGEYVERLTKSEDMELAKAMVDIEEKAAYLESPTFKKEQLKKELKSLILSLVNNIYSASYSWQQNPTVDLNVDEEFEIDNNLNCTYERIHKRIVTGSTFDAIKIRKFSIGFNIISIKNVEFVPQYDFIIDAGTSKANVAGPAILINFSSPQTDYETYTEEYTGNTNKQNTSTNDKYPNKNVLYLRLEKNNLESINKINSLIPQIK